MKKLITCLGLALTFFINAQTPKLYLNIVSHNEMNYGPPNAEPYDNPDGIFYNATKDTLKKIADMIFAKGAKYNLQTNQRFVAAAHLHQAAGTSTADIIEYVNKLGGMSGGVVEIDPRSKTATGHTLNISDVAHMIDSTGAVASKNVGGFIYKPFPGDWSAYTSTITGAVYNKQWKANIIWGAGTGTPLPLHSQDANNYGVWKPKGDVDSLNFYCHDPNQNVWIQGNGCAWVLNDTTTNIQWIIRDIRANATRIVNGTYPANKFYSATVMIGFKHFASAGFRQKLTQIVDSINVMAGQNKIVWATISQKHTAFQAWSTANSITHSQWRCGQTNTLSTTCAVASVKEFSKSGDNLLMVYPNPANNYLEYEWKGKLLNETFFYAYDNLGRMISKEAIMESKGKVSLNNLQNGIYFISISNKENISRPIKVVISK